MSQAQLHADVHVTIALWRRGGIAAAAIWQALGNDSGGGLVEWRTVRIWMLGWLAGRECLSLQRVG